VVRQTHHERREFDVTRRRHEAPESGNPREPDLVELKRELEERLHRRFDVLTEDGLSPYIRDKVLQEARLL
jgi:predicted nucleotidyltransferase